MNLNIFGDKRPRNNFPHNFLILHSWGNEPGIIERIFSTCMRKVTFTYIQTINSQKKQGRLIKIIDGFISFPTYVISNFAVKLPELTRFIFGIEHFSILHHLFSFKHNYTKNSPNLQQVTA